MDRKICTSLSIALLCLLLSFIHPIKISTCIISLQDKEKGISVKFNFFADDFSAHLKKISGQNIDLLNFPKKLKKKLKIAFLRINQKGTLF